MIFIFTSSSDTPFHSLKGHSRPPARGWRLSSYLSRIAMRCWVLAESDKALIMYSPEQRILQTPSPPPNWYVMFYVQVHGFHQIFREVLYLKMIENHSSTEHAYPKVFQSFQPNEAWQCLSLRHRTDREAGNI